MHAVRPSTVAAANRAAAKSAVVRKRRFILAIKRGRADRDGSVGRAPAEASALSWKRRQQRASCLRKAQK